MFIFFFFSRRLQVTADIGSGCTKTHLTRNSPSNFPGKFRRKILTPRKFRPPNPTPLLTLSDRAEIHKLRSPTAQELIREISARSDLLYNSFVQVFCFFANPPLLARKGPLLINKKLKGMNNGITSKNVKHKRTGEPLRRN